MAGLDDLYRQIILDHYKNPRNRGTLPPPAKRIEGYNPLCGDELAVYFNTDGKIISDVAIETSGCSISQASASLMTTAIKGKSLDEVREISHAFKRMLSVEEGEVGDVKLGDLEALAGVAKFPVRIKCATLAWNTLGQGIDEPENDAPVTTE